MAAFTVLASTVDMSLDDWLAARRQGIGSSDAAAVAGLDPWSSPITVWLTKKGVAPDVEQTEAMEFGHEMEEVVARVFARRTGYPTRRRNAILQSRQYPFMIADLDRLTQDGSGNWVPLELKTVTAWKMADWEDGKIPDHYQLQVQHQLIVTGADHGWIAAVIGGNHLVYVRVEAEPEVQSLLVEIERQFWSLIEKDTPPPVDGSPATSRMLKTLYAQGDPEKSVVVPDSDAWRHAMRRYWALSQEMKDLETEKQAIQNAFRSAMREAETLFADGEDKPLATYRAGSKPGFNMDAFRKEQPTLYQQYCTLPPSRTLRITKLREEN